MAELLDTVLTIRSYVVAAVGLVALGTLATAALVFLLSLRLRRREIETLHRIGAARSRVALLLGAEVLGVLLLGIALAGSLTLLVERFGADVIRALLLS
jgi:putative ABC transport system permease protein